MTAQSLSAPATIEGSPSSARARVILIALCMFSTGASGLVTEYVLATVSSYILGNAIEQYSVIIGLMMLMMGIGGSAQRLVGDRFLVEKFIAIELLLSLVAGFAPITIYAAYGFIPAHFQLIQYGFVMLIGFLIGFEIPIAVRINKDFVGSLRTNLAWIFSADYIGACTGALVWTFVLLKVFPLTEISFVVSSMNLMVAFVTFLYFRSQKGLAMTPAFIVAFAIVTSLFGLGFMQNRDWSKLLEQRFYDDPIVYSSLTRYQKLVVTHDRKNDEFRLYINGNVQFSSVDEANYHEPLVHPVMTLAPSREKVLILGGGDGLALRRVLEYPDVREVALVDLDPGMTAIARDNSLFRKLNRDALRDARVVAVPPEGLTEESIRGVFMEEGRDGGKLLEKKRRETTRVASVSVVNIDADRFVATAPGVWNVVIIDFPDPSSIELVKLYSKEFFLKLRRNLASDARIVIQATSPYHAKEAYLAIGRTMEAAGFLTIPYHENVPAFGDWGFYLAWLPGPSKEDMGRQIRTMERFGPETQFLTPDVFRSELVFGKGMLHTNETAVNTLMQPVLLSYYVDRAWQIE
ncbi:MAG TPA: polyamine aminopropyltransferase [Candidatus Paceibacterota bacterium]|nr:polyamine aminopropyltransferase [Candidatus Paceibacterota bacterium]